MELIIVGAIFAFIIYACTPNSESKKDTPTKPISDTEKTARFIVRQTAAHLIRQLFR